MKVRITTCPNTQSTNSLDSPYNETPSVLVFNLGHPCVRVNCGFKFDLLQVHYCEELIHRLFENLDNPHLTAVDRMGLFDDQVKD